MNYLYSGELARTTSKHKLNRSSNRSHSILTIYIQQRARSGVSERIVCSKLNLVDLAGSERLKKTMDDADGNFVLDETTKKESMYINQSLTYLEQCVVALSKKNPGHVPYRQTKLTNVLKDSIGGNCNTLMFANMWGESAHLEETISTLRLAARMMRVQNETKQNETFDDAMLVKKLTKEVKELKQELLMHDAMVERSGVSYDEYTPEQKLDMLSNIEKFLLAESGSDEEYEAISFSSVRQMRELLFQFKKIAIEKDMSIKRAATAAAAGIQNMMAGTGAIGDEAKSFGGVEFGDAKDAVGDLLDGDGFALGKAGAESRPNTIDAVGGSPTRDTGGYEGEMSQSQSMENMTLTDEAQSKTFAGTNSSMQMASETYYGGDVKGQVPEDKEEAFAMYKRTKGKHANSDMLSLKADIKQIKSKSRVLSNECNEYKEDIDDFCQKIQKKKDKRMQQMQPGGYGDDVDVVDQEEFDLMKKQREAKKAYKNRMSALADLRNKSSTMQSQVDDMKFSLLEQFDRWHGIAIGSLVDDGGGGGGMEGGEVMDDAEMFEKMELERIAANDPDSIAFFQAQKTRRANQTQNSLTIRQMGKNKRSVGV